MKPPEGKGANLHDMLLGNNFDFALNSGISVVSRGFQKHFAAGRWCSTTRSHDDESWACTVLGRRGKVRSIVSR